MAKNKKKGNSAKQKATSSQEPKDAKRNADASDSMKEVEVAVKHEEQHASVDETLEPEVETQTSQEGATASGQDEVSQGTGSEPTEDSAYRNKEIEQDASEDVALASVKKERDEYELKYNTLLSKLSSMKSVFSQMKEAQQELEMTREQLNEYESQNISLKSKLKAADSEIQENRETISTLNEEVLSLNKACEDLNNECEQFDTKVKDLERQISSKSSEQSTVNSSLNSEIRSLKSQVENLEIIINNEKQDKRDLEEQILDYQQQLKQNIDNSNQLERLVSELKGQLADSEKTIETLSRQRASEVSEFNEHIARLTQTNEEKAAQLSTMEKQVKSMKEEVALKEKFEQEVKERVLQIGKLRHEAIILNEHLTKALAMLKQSNDSENVDKELISNLFISFVTIPRGDPKKYEVLELISSFLNWDTDKKTQAGLIQNPNASRTESRTQNFVSLWTEFLEKESEK